MSSPARIGGAILAVAALAVFAIIFMTGSDGYTVRAELENAAGVRKNSSVKIAGVPGGKVKEFEITDDDTAIAILSLDENAAPIGEGASIKIRPTDLLGERYIALDPGDRSKPQESNPVVPIEQTAQPVELDQILNVFNADTRARVRLLVNEFGVAMQGRGADFNKLLDELPPGLEDAQELVKEVADENESLERLVTNGDSLLKRINTKRDDFGETIEQADRALTTIADKRERLGETLRTAPGGLAALRDTMDNVRTASASLGPAADSLRRTTVPLTAALKTLPSFEDSAEDTLKAAVTASPAIRKLASGATSPLRSVRPTADALTGLLGESGPAVGSLDRRVMKDAMWFLQNWALGLKGRDGLGHFIGAHVTISGNEFKSIFEGFKEAGTAQPKTEPEETPPTPRAKSEPEKRAAEPEAKRKAKLPEVKLPKLKDLPKTLKDLPKKVGELPKDVMKALPKVDKGLKDSVDGLGNRLGGQQQRQQGSDASGLFDYLFAP